MRPLSALLTFTLIATALLPALASAKHHHPAKPSPLALAQANHRIRLAAKQKKAWREHLVKLHSLPHSERVAEKRHEKVWQRKHDAKVAHLQKAKRVQVTEAPPKRHHALKAAAVPKKLIAKNSLVHARRLAALAAAHQRGITARQENAAHRVKMAAAAYQARLANHQARLAASERVHALHALHQTKIAAAAHAKGTRWAALHGSTDSSGAVRNIRFWETGAAGIPVKVISVDLNDPNVKVSAVMAARGNGTAEPFRQMISRANPNVAVTGTFFSLDDLQPVGDIVIDGSLVHFGGMGTALCITPSNHAAMVTCRWGRHHDWSSYDFVVACGPRLLHDGRVVLDARAEKFRDKHMLAPNSRIAVGITPGNTLFFVMTHSPISLGKLARVMQALGAADAMNLDAGTSTGFYYNGATLAKPGRKLTNMIVVYGRRDRYERALDQLVSPAYHRAASRRTPVKTQTASALVHP